MYIWVYPLEKNRMRGKSTSPLYPGVSDFVALRAGKAAWYMAQASDVDQEKMEVEVNYIKNSGHSFVFTEGEPSWIGMVQILQLCTLPGIGNR